MKTQPSSPLRPLPGPSAPPVQVAQPGGDEQGLGGSRRGGVNRSPEDIQAFDAHEGTQPPPLDAAQQRLFTSIMSQRYEINEEVIQNAIENARAKHAQKVLPLDHRMEERLLTPRSPQELAKIGADKLEKLKHDCFFQVLVHPKFPKLTMTMKGQIIHDIVTKYFHAGLKADNKAPLTEDRTRPVQTFREFVRRAAQLPEERNFDDNKNEQTFLARFAYGLGNCDSQAETCSRLAKRMSIPNAVIGISDPLAPEAPRFGHTFMVLTPTQLDATGLKGGSCNTIANFSSDWVVVDPWMKIVCRGDEYESKVDDKLGKWEGKAKVLLNHKNETAFSPRSEGVLATFRQGKPG